MRPRRRALSFCCSSTSTSIFWSWVKSWTLSWNSGLQARHRVVECLARARLVVVDQVAEVVS